MINILQKRDCCGCSSCYSICPSKAISMTYDEEGFKYPIVDQKKCIDCTLCEKVCPIGKYDEMSDPLEAYIAQNRNDQIRCRSTSGAVVNVVAAYVLQQNGLVFGAALDKNVVCRHICVESEKGLERIQGSKYVQSDLGCVFLEVKKALQANRLVLFVGMPCQVAGLKAFLRKEYELLITIDLACHGVPSPKVFEEYVDYLSNKYNKKVTEIIFRDKTYGYAASNVKVIFSDGTSRDCKNDVKTFTRLMFAGITLRPACYVCRFKTRGRISDMTLFDCASVGALYPDMDDDLGTTSILIQSQKGISIINNVSVQNSLRIRKADPEKLIHEEGTMLVTSAEMNPRRGDFFTDRKTMPYEQLVREYAPITLKMVVGNIIKKTIRYTGPLGRYILKWNKKRSIQEYKRKYQSR